MEIRGVFHSARSLFPIGWNANETRGSNGNYPEQMEHLRRYSTFSTLTDWNGSYCSICTKFPFLLLPNLLALTPTSCAIITDERFCKFFARVEKAFPFETETFRNFKPKILAKWKAPQDKLEPVSLVVVFMIRYCAGIMWKIQDHKLEPGSTGTAMI